VHALARRLALHALGRHRRRVSRALRAREPEPSRLRADTLERLETLLRGDSRLARLLAGPQARASVAGAARESLHHWRTLLWLDSLWSRRVVTRFT
jgi:hypothetical protein